MSGKIYSSTLASIGSFVYPIEPAPTNNPMASIHWLADDADNRYYLVDAGRSLPQSSVDEFKLVTDEQTLNWLKDRVLAKGLSFNFPEDLARLKEAQKALVRIGFERDYNKVVATEFGDFDGGFESAVKLDAAMRLNQAAGLTTVEFFDAYNSGHELAFSDALIVVVAVAGLYQRLLAQKQMLMKSIDNCNDATMLKSIVWFEPN